MAGLKPCPFCGGEVKIEGGAHKSIFCIRCRTFDFYDADTERMARKWNTRHYPAEVQQAIDKQKPELAIITKELGYHPDGDVYEVGCPDCGKVLRYVNFVRGATTDCIRHCMDCGKKMNVRIDAEVEDE